MGSYSREGYAALKPEVTENTAVIPDTFFPIMSEDITPEWGATPAMPVSAKRTKNLRSIQTAIPAPTGTINLEVEPNTIGYFLKGVYGSINSGQLMRMTVASGDWTVGDTVTGGSSLTTATVAFVSSELDYLLVTSPSATFTDGETITNASTGTGTLTQHDATVFGHEFTAPQSTLPTFTMEIGYAEKSYRYTGTRFNAISFAQSDNIMTAAVTMTARAVFTHARVTTIESAGVGAHTLLLDQTTGLVVADSIKVYRPGTGFLDFSAASVKTHAIGTIPSETSITITNLETSLAVGDLIMLAPQTPSYDVTREFSWIGGSDAVVNDGLTAAITAGTSATDCIEDFEFTLTNNIEPKHCAKGTNIVDRFPAANYLTGLEGSGSLTRTYTDDTFFDRLRNNTSTAIYITTQGDQIGVTGQYDALELRTPSAIFQPFNANISEDDLLNQEMSYDIYDSTTDGFAHKALLVNDIASYTT